MEEVKGGIWYLYFSNGQKDTQLSELFDEKMNHYKLCYTFLPPKQVRAKVYEKLNIPHRFGNVDRTRLHKMYLETRKCDLPIIEKPKKPCEQNFCKKICFYEKSQSLPKTFVKASSDNTNRKTVSAPNVLRAKSTKEFKDAQTPLRLRKSVTFKDGVQVIDISPNQPRKIDTDSHKSCLQGRYIPRALTAELEKETIDSPTPSRNEIPKPTVSSVTPISDTDNSMKNTLTEQKQNEVVKLPPTTVDPTENKLSSLQAESSNNIDKNTKKSSIMVENENSIDFLQSCQGYIETSIETKNRSESLADPYTYEKNNDQVSFLNNFSLQNKSPTLIKSNELQQSKIEKEIDSSSKHKSSKKPKSRKVKKKIFKRKSSKSKIPPESSETEDTQLLEKCKKINDAEAKDFESFNEMTNRLEVSVHQSNTDLEETNYQLNDECNKFTIGEETVSSSIIPIQGTNQSNQSPVYETNQNMLSYYSESNNNGLSLPHSPEKHSMNNNQESDYSDMFHKNLENNDLSNVMRYNTVFGGSSENLIENEYINHGNVNEKTSNEDSLWSTLNEETDKQNSTLSNSSQIWGKKSLTQISCDLSSKEPQGNEGNQLQPITPEESPSSENEIIPSVNSSPNNLGIISSKTPQMLSPNTALRPACQNSSAISSNDNSMIIENSEMEYSYQRHFRESKIAQYRNSDDSSFDSHFSQTSFDDDTLGSQGYLDSESISSLRRATMLLNINDDKNLTNDESLIISNKNQIEDGNYTDEKSYNQAETSYRNDAEEKNDVRTKSSIVSLSVSCDSSLSFRNRSVHYFNESRILSDGDKILQQDGLQANVTSALDEQEVEDNMFTSEESEYTDSNMPQKNVANSEEVSTAYETEKETGRLKLNRTLQKPLFNSNIKKEMKEINQDISFDVGASNRKVENTINSPHAQPNIDNKLEKEIRIANWLHKSTIANLIGINEKYVYKEKKENVMSGGKSLDSKEISFIHNSEFIETGDLPFNKMIEENVMSHNDKLENDTSNFSENMELNRQLYKSQSVKKHTSVGEMLNSSEIRQSFQKNSSPKRAVNSDIDSKGKADLRYDSPTNNVQFSPKNLNYAKNINTNEENYSLNSINQKTPHSESDPILSHSFSETTDSRKVGKYALNWTLPLTTKTPLIYDKDFIKSSEDSTETKLLEFKDQTEQESNASMTGDNDFKVQKIITEKMKINKFNIKTRENNKQENLEENTVCTENKTLIPISAHSTVVKSNIICNRYTAMDSKERNVSQISDNRLCSEKNIEIENSPLQGRISESLANEIVIIKKEPENSDSDTRNKKSLGERSPSVIFSSQEITHGKRKNHELRRTRAKLLKSQTEVIMISSSSEEDVRPVRRRTNIRSGLMLGNINLHPSFSKARKVAKTKLENNYDLVSRKLGRISEENTTQSNRSSYISSHFGRSIVSPSQNFSSNIEKINEINLHKAKEDMSENDDSHSKLKSIRAKSRILAKDILSSHESKMSNGNNVRPAKKLNMNENTPPRDANSSPIKETPEESRSPPTCKSISMREALRYDKWYRSRMCIGSDSTDSRETNQRLINQENIKRKSIEEPERISEHTSNVNEPLKEKMSAISHNGPILSKKLQDELGSMMSSRSNVTDSQDTNQKPVNWENKNKKLLEKTEVISESENALNFNESLKKKMSAVSFNSPVLSGRPQLQDVTTSKYFQNNNDVSHDISVQSKRSPNKLLKVQRKPLQDISNESANQNRPLVGQMLTDLDSDTINSKGTHRSAIIFHTMEIDSPDFYSDSDSQNELSNKRRKKIEKILEKRLKSQNQTVTDIIPSTNKSDDMLAKKTELTNTKENSQDKPTTTYSKSSTVTWKEMTACLQESSQPGKVLLRRTFFMEKPSE